MKYTIIEMRSGFAWEVNTQMEAFEKVQEIREVDPNTEIRIEVE